MHMNIAEITTYKEGGIYTHVVELIKHFNQKPLIITGNSKLSGYRKENQFKFYHIPRLFSIWGIFFINYPGSYRKLKKIFKENNIDIAHFHNPMFSFCIGLIHKSDIPRIMTTHYILDIKSNKLFSKLYSNLMKFITKSIAKRIEKIICVNEDYISRFIEWGVDKNKLVFIPNGIDTKKFSPGESKIKKKYPNNQLIIYFGRLHYQKNVDILINSFKHIKNKMSESKLIIIGDGTDFNRLKKMSMEFGNDIIMTGYLADDNELIDYIRAADVVVFPSRGENASYTLLEAMGCCIPVISSDVGNARKLLSQNRGILLEKYSEQELAEKCIYVLQNPSQAKAMAKKGHNYIVKHYSLEKITANLEELYKNISSIKPC